MRCCCGVVCRVVLSLPGAGLAGSKAEGKRPGRPNIVFILADDKEYLTGDRSGDAWKMRHRYGAGTPRGLWAARAATAERSGRQGPRCGQSP